MNSVVCSRFLSKILLTTFASTACLRVGKFDKVVRWPVGRYLVELSRRYRQDSLTGVVTDQLDPYALQVYHWHWILSYVEENKCQH